MKSSGLTTLVWASGHKLVNARVTLCFFMVFHFKSMKNPTILEKLMVFETVGKLKCPVISVQFSANRAQGRQK